MDKPKTQHPVNGKTPELGKQMSIRQAAIASFSFFYHNMLVNEEGTLQNRDPEFLHYLRVSSKRLRVAFSIFRPYFRKKDINHFKDEVKTLAPVLGKARDIDVYLEFLIEDVLPETTPEDMEDIRRYISFFRKHRDGLQTPVAARILSARHRRFKSKFEAFLAEELQKHRNPAGSSRLCRLAEKEMEDCIRKLRKAAGRLSRKSGDHKLHMFRIRCRKMRYRIEMFLNLLGKKGAILDRKLVSLQNALGAQHDSVTAVEKLDHYLDLHPQFKRSPALKRLRKLHMRRASKFRRKFFRRLSAAS